MRVGIQIEGLDEVVAAIQRMGPAGRLRAKAVLKQACDEVVPRAQAMTPVEPEDGGALRDSVRSTRPSVTAGGRISCGVIAGGAPLAASLAAGHHHENVYALIQHEDLTLKHTVGGPKFIEIPMMAMASQVPERLMAAFGQEFKP